ncbi:MAG: 1-acyl-sn-glycerol-3-phosphate acyltransferase [Bryobacteraceae bacterium]|nr:1-acyl-sn-glycerol-3-phosphate acyltransferase [Bryobacteraceae bacterium]MDW8379373.1 lysophospholipid acyltransferase family protein [Bryobacterales bacterium]
MLFRYLRSYCWTGPMVILATVIYGTLDLLVSFFDGTGDTQHRIAVAWSRALLWIGGVRVSVIGLEKIQPNGSYVFAANHLSYSDTPTVLAHIPCNFRFMAKEGLFKIPFIGFHLRRGGHIPVPREDARGAVRALQEAARMMRERAISVLLFPEGGRTEGELRPFKEGAAMLAIAAGKQIVPVMLKGTREVMPMGSLLMTPGLVEVRIGDPIPTEGLSPRDRGILTERVRNAIAAMQRESAHQAALV